MLGFIVIVGVILMLTGVVLALVSLWVDEWRGKDLCELGVKALGLGFVLALGGAILLPLIYYFIA